MLEFWFDPHITISRKLSFLAVFAAITTLLYVLVPLNLTAILMFLGTGLVFLICRYCNIHLKNIARLPARILRWIPIALLIAVIFMQFKHGDILILGAQGIGFMTLSVCVFSLFSLCKRKES